MGTDLLITESTTCFHCGEPCREDTVRLEGKAFCCSGCKMVYEILDENELNTYYCLEEKPGISFKNRSSSGRFDFLDDASVVERLADFRNGGFVSLRLYIPNIHCTSCVWLLENLYKLDEGIAKSSVNFLKKELSITYNEKATGLRAVVELLASIGYEPELRMEQLDRKAASSPDRRLWLKLGVAGFAFGNIMLFSFPEYLSGSALSGEGSFHIVFGVLNIALALPVLLFSASDYLKSAWAAVRQGGINLDVPISIGILALFTRSVYEIAAGVGAGYMDSLTGLVFFLLIGRIIQKKTYERLSFDRDYKSYLPISVTIKDETGREQSVSIDRIKEGDCMLIRNNELVPADAILLPGTGGCFVDYSFITGESEPLEVKEGETVYAGGRIVGPSVELRAAKEVSNSYLTKLWNDSAFDDGPQKAAVSSLADRISPWFTAAVLGIAVAAGIFWWFQSTGMAITVFTAVLIIACPCALALSTPFTLGSSLNILSKNGLYVKGIEVIERLAGTTSVVFDKTGTLTRADRAEVTFEGKLTPEEEKLVKSACRQSLHPLSRKIADHLKAAGTAEIQSFDETVNKGIEVSTGGHRLLIGSASFIEEQDSLKAEEKTERSSAVSVVHIAVDGDWKGCFRIANSYRPGIKGLLENFRARFATFLLSGDNESQKKQFAPFFGDSSLRFNQTPQQKLDFIKGLQKEGGHVVMVGDGLNDAGALKQSDFGIALTDNLSSFTPACDAILDGDSLARLDTFIDFSKASITVIKLSFALSLAYNLIGLGFAVAGQLSPLVAAILMPLSSISIMIFTTAGTHLAAKREGLLTWK